MIDWKEVEQLGTDIEAGRRVSAFRLVAQLGYLFPDKTAKQLSDLVQEAIRQSDWLH